MSRLFVEVSVTGMQCKVTVSRYLTLPYLFDYLLYVPCGTEGT
jgi:hypothetical protein